jgi:hypothetical protein
MAAPLPEPSHVEQDSPLTITLIEWHTHRARFVAFAGLRNLPSRSLELAWQNSR